VYDIGTVSYYDWDAANNTLRGSFEQRRLLDADPFALKTGDLSSHIEFYLPLVFYVFDWLVFFLTIPRNWNTVQKQRSPEQAALIAAPAATDMRFKAGGIVSAICFAVILFSLIHSRLRYRASLRKTLIPWLMFGLAIHTGYWVASAWMWDLNPFNLETDLGFQYSLDYLTALMIIIHSNIMGYLNDNDDKILLRNRAARGQAVDGQLGLQNANVKPPWWSRSTSRRGKPKRDHDLEMKIFHTPGTHPRNLDEDESGSWWWQKRKEKKDSPIDPGTELYQVNGSSMLQPEGPPLRRRTSQTQSEASGSGLSNYSTFEAKPQVVRSMLDM
jgi:Protein of unknown function (DUF2434)